ncbi:class I SAM-dependent methyltransferase [Bacillus sp. HMF5848]|uniref:class I SAM-dependent methyltransferase n=1 Tax=Bacillus sp. HMF5848 TaxID=2495421 RepID=UPI000F767DCA|nr:class I SAM-dependent methyltransferase [Bacillus sp. HMF5848]RSK26085.1 class I SAM-dependent methyltransferase [Bacillus sp. HMF5848]
MDYITSNKEAWEEAFEKKADGWGKDITTRLQQEKYPYLKPEFVEELQQIDFTNKTVGQFCCNNGRELLSIMQFGAAEGVGFDIAANMVKAANDVAQQVGYNCSFVQANILEIDETYHGYFDYIVITVGAITWFEDLSAFFKKVSLCLKEKGKVLMHEIHPVTNMLATTGEELYDPNVPNKLTYSYFKKDPWVENTGMGYMSGDKYQSKTFYSYSHTFADIFNALSVNELSLKKLREFAKDESAQFVHLDHKGIPLTYVLVAEK